MYSKINVETYAVHVMKGLNSVPGDVNYNSENTTIIVLQTVHGHGWTIVTIPHPELKMCVNK